MTTVTEMDIFFFSLKCSQCTNFNVRFNKKYSISNAPEYWRGVRLYVAPNHPSLKLLYSCAIIRLYANKLVNKCRDKSVKCAYS